MFRTFARIIAVAAVCGALTGAAQAAIVLSDDFNAYTSGSLVGQGGWGQTGTSTVNPIQVTNGQVPLVTNGQDAYRAFSSTVPNANGTGIYTGFDVTVTSAATGDYFFHLSDPAGTTTYFYQRIFVKSATGGYVLGLVDTSGTGSATTYGTTVLQLNQPYHISVAWNFVGNATNKDTFSLYVNPTDAVEGSNTPYLTHTWTSTSMAEPAQLSAANLRQGTNGSAPGVTLDNVVVATTFGEVVPEPATLALLAVGAAFFRRTRRG